MDDILITTTSLARKRRQDDFEHISLSSLNLCKAEYIHRGGGRAAADKGKVDRSLQTRYKCHCHYHTQPLLSLVWKEMKHKAKACPSEWSCNKILTPLSVSSPQGVVSVCTDRLLSMVKCRQFYLLWTFFTTAVTDLPSPQSRNLSIFPCLPLAPW